MISKDEIIKAIAVENHVAIKKDDPIMVVVTMLQKFSENMTEYQNAMLANFEERLEEISFNWQTKNQSWQNDAGKKATEALNAAIAASQVTMNKTMLAGAQQVVEIVNQKIASGHEKLSAEKAEIGNLVKQFRVACIVCLIGGFAALAAAIMQSNA